MPKVSVEIEPSQVISAIEQLSDREKWEIARDIVEKQFNIVVSKFRNTIAKKGLNYRKVNYTISEARKEFYAKSPR